MIARLTRCRRGAAVVEFALLAPAFFIFLFLIIEGGRMIWTRQVLQQTAVASVRCFALRTTACDTQAKVQSWASARARASGVRLATGAITATPATSCSGRGGMNRVAISSPFRSAVGSILPQTTTTLRVSACFPSV